LSAASTSAEFEYEKPQDVGQNEAWLEPTSWQPRRYLDDKRPFLVKFKEIADAFEVFPFQWGIFPGTLASNLLDNAFVNHQDAQSFYHFADLARTATTNDLDQCVAYLAEATPKEKVLLLVVLHFSLDDTYLPVIARYVDDDSVPFPRIVSEQDKAWREERIVQCNRERIRLGREVRAKKSARAALSAFEKRVDGDNQRFQMPPFASTSQQSWSGIAWLMDYVGCYALAILDVRGCKLVESMREMPLFRNKPRPSTMVGSDLPFTVENVFTDEAWRQFRSMPFDVRRLHHEYLLEVECVPPPYQEEAVAGFVKKLESMPPRTVALACFSVAASICYELEGDRVLVPNWREYALRIPKEQIEELLTSADLGSIDATLAPEAQFGWFRGYRPYFPSFLRHVFQQRSQWYNEDEFTKLLPRLNPPARETRTYMKLFEANRKGEG
jgi:hypothetical protein